MCLEGNQLVSVSAMVSRFYLNKHQAKQQFDGVFVSKLMCQTVQVSLTSHFYGSEFRLYNQLKWSKYPIVYQGFIHPNQVVQKKSSIQR